MATAARDDVLRDALHGIKGRTRPGPSDPDYLARPTVNALLPLVADVGIAGRDAELYVCQWFRRYLGAAMVTPPTPPKLRNHRGPDNTPLAEWIELRAWEVLDEHRGELPPLVDDRAPRSVRERDAGITNVGRYRGINVDRIAIDEAAE